MTPPAIWWLVGSASEAVISRLTPVHPMTVTAFTQTAPFVESVLREQPLRPSAVRVVLLAAEPGHAVADRDEGRWRRCLADFEVPHQVVFPQGGTHDAPLRRLMGLDPIPSYVTYAAWACERCADPEREHRLFRQLLDDRPLPR